MCVSNNKSIVRTTCYFCSIIFWGICCYTIYNICSFFIFCKKLFPFICPIVVCIQFYRVTCRLSICSQLNSCFFRTTAILVVTVIPFCCQRDISTWNYRNLYRIRCDTIPCCSYTNVSFFNTCNSTFVVYSCNCCIVALPCDFRIFYICRTIPCFCFNRRCITLYYAQLICRSKNQSCVRCYFYIAGCCRLKRIALNRNCRFSRRNSSKVQ